MNLGSRAKFAAAGPLGADGTPQFRYPSGNTRIGWQLVGCRAQTLGYQNVIP